MDLNVHDCGIRFRTSIIGMKDGDKVKPCYVSNFDGGRKRGEVEMYYRLVDGNEWGDEQHMNFDADPNKFLLDMPKLGLFNVAGGMYHIQRTPIRQYKRGFVKKTIKVMNPFADEAGVINRRSVTKDSLKLIDQVFNPVYPSAQEALSMIAKRSVLSVAFNRQFGFGFRYNYKYPVLVYKKYDVGYIKDGVVHLNPKSNHLFEQLSQYVECQRGEV